MPQMSPMMWLYLFFFFCLVFSFFLILTYFLIPSAPWKNFDNFSKSDTKKSPKWKW
uniref:ATP synthase complex subunit 8 n=1 Tax=Lysmata sp. 1 LQZ-2020 TaxID=2735370 RepID=A0A8X8RGE6_9EUCA|nr:ATP synthase F0 subunit 8 [Lysmata sp. 1 LQZ-2020]